VLSSSRSRSKASSVIFCIRSLHSSHMAKIILIFVFLAFLFPLRLAVKDISFQCNLIGLLNIL